MILDLETPSGGPRRGAWAAILSSSRACWSFPIVSDPPAPTILSGCMRWRRRSADEITPGIFASWSSDIPLEIWLILLSDSVGLCKNEMTMRSEGIETWQPHLIVVRLACGWESGQQPQALTIAASTLLTTSSYQKQPTKARSRSDGPVRDSHQSKVPLLCKCTGLMIGLIKFWSPLRSVPKRPME